MTKIVGGEDDVLDDGALFFMQPEPTIFLRDRYMEPPFTVLDRRTGSWQARDRQWKALGIQSELGRDVRLLTTGGLQGDGATFTSETSIFSPALAELMYRWYSRPGATVLDPFAGGSVRGIVAAHLGRRYIGLELSGAQVMANRAQLPMAPPEGAPIWVHADSRITLADWAQGEHAETMDMILSCPPYAHLEKYSDDPADISNMPYPKFLEAYRDIIRDAAAMLAPDRFAVWVIGEVREKGGDGSCLGVIADTVNAFRDAGMELYNDHVMLTPIGTAPQRAPKQFDAARKAGRVHEYVLVFVKGDARKASQWLGNVQDKAIEED
jgi:Predicted DNA modification methylase